jgi:GTP-binding protein LepA
MISKLKDALDRQNFEIIIQCAIGGKILGRERLAPYRKDVLNKSGKLVGGGDMTRKKKLLENQKEKKKLMKAVGNVEVSDEAFLSVMKAQSKS